MTGFYINYNGVIILQTKRLALSEATVDDAHFFMELMNSSNWLPHIGDRGIDDIKKAESYIEDSLLNSYRKNGFGLYKVLLKPLLEPVGICGFVKRDYLEHPDIGFAILPKFEGKGYMSEAALATISYGFEVLKFQTILAVTTEENQGSKKILDKIGLEYVKRIEEKKDRPEFLLYSKRALFKS